MEKVDRLEAEKERLKKQDQIDKDLQQVMSQTMSRQEFIQKWNEKQDKQALEELEKIARERQLLEDSYMSMDGE